MRRPRLTNVVPEVLAQKAERPPHPKKARGFSLNGGFENAEKIAGTLTAFLVDGTGIDIATSL